MGAHGHTLAAARTVIRMYFRPQTAVLLHLALTRGAAHARVLDGSAEARQFMPLEMADGDEHVRVHNVPGQIERVEMFAREGHGPFVAAFETVGDDDRRTQYVGIKAVPGGLKPVGGRLTALAHIQGVGVRQKGLGSAFADESQEGDKLQRLDVGRASGLAEMQFDGGQVAALQLRAQRGLLE